MAEGGERTSRASQPGRRHTSASSRPLRERPSGCDCGDPAYQWVLPLLTAVNPLDDPTGEWTRPGGRAELRSSLPVGGACLSNLPIASMLVGQRVP
jgi:hypothetical protein